MSDAEEEERIYALGFTTDLIDLIHRVVLQRRWVIKQVDSPGEMHYGHGETPQTQFFAVRIWGVLTPTFDFVTAGWLAGLEIPPPGPAREVPVEWSLGDLPAHGTIDCPENGCRATGAEALAVLKFVPRPRARAFRRRLSFHLARQRRDLWRIVIGEQSVRGEVRRWARQSYVSVEYFHAHAHLMGR